MPTKKKTAKKTTKKAAPKKKVVKKAAPKKKVAKKVVRKTVKKAAPKKKVVKKVAKKVVRKTVKKAAPKKKVAKKATKRKPNAAFMRPMELSSDLGAVVGSKPIPRTEVTKKLWAYIKKNGLQDAKNRRMINADDKLKKVFGGKKQVSMFEMTKLVSKHLK